jgi:hypothetical protein
MLIQPRSHAVSTSVGFTRLDRLSPEDCDLHQLWWGYVDLNHGPLPYQFCPEPRSEGQASSILGAVVGSGGPVCDGVAVTVAVRASPPIPHPRPHQRSGCFTCERHAWSSRIATHAGLACYIRTHDRTYVATSIANEFRSLP